MSRFKDANHREWHLDITVNELRRVKKMVDLDLLDLEEGRTIARLANDPILLVDVLWILCEDQAQKEGITDEQFGRSLRGEVIEHATEALFEALTDFFPPQRQILLRKLIETARTMGQKERALVEMYVNSPALEEFMDQQIEELKQKLETALKKKPADGNSSMSLPGSAESTPENSVSDPSSE